MKNTTTINTTASAGARRLASAIGIAAFVICVLAAPAFAEAPSLSEGAMQQIQTLMAEKASRSPAQRKIDSNLLYSLKRQRGDALFRAVPTLRTRADVARDGTTLVDIRAEVSDTLLEYIARLGGTVVNSVPRYDAVRARVPLDALETLAADPAVRSIRTADRYMVHKLDTSEGDITHATDAARTMFPGIDGSGVKIGVLSDSVDALAALQASGDLPPVVTVLPGQDGTPASSEGTAMLEIIFDLAPGADLLFATAAASEAQFAANILGLATAGATVIVDGVNYAAEGVFQDGTVADAVNTFTAAGGLYFSAAGNSGNLNDGTSGVWEGDFASAAPPPGLATFCGGGPCDTADFGSGASLNVITKDTPFWFTLKWSDPLGASGNDYDLALLSADGSMVFDFSSNMQDGDDDPFEFIDSVAFDDLGLTLAIIKVSGDSRCLHLNANRGALGTGTDGQINGHAATSLGFGVAAVDVATAGGFPFTGGAANPVETFSSDGPRRIILDGAGSPITPGDFSCSGGVELAQPFIAAADGVSTATPGFSPFFGTSAAAPHAAAIAALMQTDGDLSPLGAAQLFAQTALDIEAVSFDRDSGVGVLDGLNVVGAVSTSGSCDCGLATQACPDDLDFVVQVNNPPAAGTINQHLRGCGTLSFGDGDFTGVSGAAETLIFTDGFESGDTSVWSTTVP